MVSARMENLEMPYDNEDSLPRLQTAPVSVAHKEEAEYLLQADRRLTPSERGRFVSKYSAQILTTFRAMQSLETSAGRGRARALLLGRMFSELGMFGTPPPKEVPEEFVAAAQAPEPQEDGKHIARLISDYEEHPVIMAIDGSIDRLNRSSAERVEAVQMLRGAAILINQAYERFPAEIVAEEERTD